MPLKDPNAGKKLYPCPWPKALELLQIKRVADFWTGGDCDRARALPDSLFHEVHALAMAQEQGRAIEAENAARESERKSRLDRMQRAA